MNTRPEIAKNEQELVKLYKRKLEDWRDVFYHLNTIFLWDKMHFPAIIAGVITVIFMVLWYFDPSVLTTISIFAIVVCVLDYGVPMLNSYIFDANKWTGSKERKFEEICLQLVQIGSSTKSAWNALNNYRANNSKVYFIGVVSFLLFVAWIGNVVNNLLLTYLLVLAASLYPGIKHHGMIKNITSQIFSFMKENPKQD